MIEACRWATRGLVVMAIPSGSGAAKYSHSDFPALTTDSCSRGRGRVYGGFKCSPPADRAAACGANKIFLYQFMDPLWLPSLPCGE